MGAAGFLLARRRAKTNEKLAEVESMTIAQLRHYADREGFTVSDKATRRAEILLELEDATRGEYLRRNK